MVSSQCTLVSDHLCILFFCFLQAIQILNGAIILSLGVFMGSLQNLPHPSNYIFFLIVYTGYQIWSAISVSIQISLTVANFLDTTARNVFWQIFSQILGVAWSRNKSSINSKRVEMESNFGRNIANATVALVGLVFLSINLFANDPLLKDCQSSQPQGLCIYKEASSSVCL
ncbi:membrane-spanning 4-domains subfamily A member 3 [Tursiops truncatus]|uniref:membrane-spanning 4-domains subfamily A member 3 n=1 Tax=Tursiops truncatus TaxID=9739 RepID=UPI003CCFD504